MGTATTSWSDRLAEAAGAIALGAGAGVSGWLLAPLAGQGPSLVGSAAAIGGSAIGWLIMLAVPSASPKLPAFDPLEVEPLDEEPHDELLLDEPVARPSARVVQLFDPGTTPGELQARIAAHLGQGDRAAARAEGPTPWDRPPAIPDASNALHAALDDIRRSLRGN